MLTTTKAHDIFQNCKTAPKKAQSREEANPSPKIDVAFYFILSAHIDDNCMDRPDAQCDTQKSQGACNGYSPDMHRDCRKTCGLCHICEDHETTENCTNWRTWGVCDDPAHKIDMMSVCQKTCGFCGEYLVLLHYHSE